MKHRFNSVCLQTQTHTAGSPARSAPVRARFVFLFAFAFAFFIFSGASPARAVDYPFVIDNGSIAITLSGSSIQVIHGASPGSADIISTSDTITIRGSGTTANTVTVDNVTANITLRSVDIDVSGTGTPGDYTGPGTPGSIAFEITGGASVDLTLTGDNILKSGAHRAGLQVEGSNKLFIHGTGAVNANGGSYGAGIGGGGSYGGDGGDGGTIHISEGTVTANGVGGAGIGGGYSGSGVGGGGTITISGGMVTATGTSGGAGIGGGYLGGGGNISISGGTVKANGGSSGAGIGGGRFGDGDTIRISGGMVDATGGDSSAGIGGGYQGGGGTITISGGTVTATKGSGSGRDIGHGASYFGSLGTITITGGSVHPMTGAGATEVSPQPTNGSVGVWLNTLTVGSLTTVEAITACAIDGGTTPYGINDVYTDVSGKVYFWLPNVTSGDVEVTANNKCYDKDFPRNTNTTNTETLVILSKALVLVPSASYSFGTRQEGYAQPTAYTVIIYNGGSLQLDDLSVALSGASASAFTLTPPAVTSLDINDSTTFDVQPAGGLSPGTYTETITVSATDAASRTFDVSFTVDAQGSGPGSVSVTGVTLDSTKLTLAVGASQLLTAIISPNNATDKGLTWSSDNPGVVSVDQSGRVTALAPGTAVITVTTSDGSFTATCTVTVTETGVTVAIDLSGLNLESNILRLTRGQSVDLTITASPSGAEFTVTGLPDWLKLSTAGRLTGTAEATGYWVATVTATLPDGSTGEAAFIITARESDGSSGSSGNCASGIFGAGGLAILTLSAATLRPRSGGKRGK